MKLKNITAASLIAGIGFTGFATAAHATEEPTTKTVEWLTTNTEEPTNVTVNWPQSLLTEGACGWVQVDVYRYGTPEDIALVDAILADGILTQGEDYSVVESWSFRHIECAVVVPPVEEPPVVVPPVVEAPPVDVPAPPVVTEPVAAVAAPELAMTGVGSLVFVWALGALALLLSGIMFIRKGYARG